MNDFSADAPKGAPVPTGRLKRASVLGATTAAIAGDVALGGLKRLAQGERPKLSDLLLTPNNARRIADDMARLRGATMKVGQLMSMEVGELMPPEIAQQFERLRAAGETMPPAQVRDVLQQELGCDFTRHFKRFNPRPIAAASIGQVHRAMLKDGREVAIKLQYPGVKESIDSDVSNIARLMKLSGAIPSEFDMGSLLETARQQLHEEADYEREAAQMESFRIALKADPRFVIPEHLPDLNTPHVLVMEFLESQPLESVETAPQDQRDTVTNALISLLLWELFDARHMQTDPNLANYRIMGDGKIALLDFGAARRFPEPLVEGYRQLLIAGLSGVPDEINAAATQLGYFEDAMPDALRQRLLVLFDMVMEPLRTAGTYDFGKSDLLPRLRDAGMEMAMERSLGPTPPPDSLFLHRKVAGMFLLAVRMKARLDVGAMVAPYATSGR